MIGFDESVMVLGIVLFATGFWLWGGAVTLLFFLGTVCTVVGILLAYSRER